MVAIRQRVTVQPGGVIELRSSELPPGSQADVIVLLETSPAPEQPLASFIGAGKGCFSDAAEVDAFIRAERDAWDR